MKGLIYLATNQINGKVYVGQTINSLKRRQSNHKQGAFVKQDHYYFHKALRKYGFDNFVWEILEEFDIELDIHLFCLLNEAERKYIALYNSNNPQNGYNMTKGGDCYSQQAKDFWDDDERSLAWRKSLSEKMTIFWSDEKNRLQHQQWMLDYYNTEQGKAQALKHSQWMKEYYNGENAKINKAKTSKWFVKATSPEGEETIYVSSKEPNIYFQKDIHLRKNLKNVGDIWKPTKRSELYGWTFEAIEKFELN